MNRELRRIVRHGPNDAFQRPALPRGVAKARAHCAVHQGAAGFRLDVGEALPFPHDSDDRGVPVRVKDNHAVVAGRFAEVRELLECGQNRMLVIAVQQAGEELVLHRLVHVFLVAQACFSDGSVKPCFQANDMCGIERVEIERVVVFLVGARGVDEVGASVVVGLSFVDGAQAHSERLSRATAPYTHHGARKVEGVRFFPSLGLSSARNRIAEVCFVCVD